MAEKHEIRDIVVRPLTANYGLPKDDPEAFVELLLKTLSGFSPQALDHAVTKLVMGRRYKTWPTIAEIVEAARSLNGEKGKVRHPSPLSGVNKENFSAQSKNFIERDYAARGTCLERVRQGTREWEAWAVYFIEYLGFRHEVLNKIEWHAPTRWPSEFDADVGLKADQAVIDFEEYDPEEDVSDDFVRPEEEKQKIQQLWAELREKLLHSGKKQTNLTSETAYKPKHNNTSPGELMDKLGESLGYNS